MTDSNEILRPFLGSLLAKWIELTRVETRHHPESPDVIEDSIAWLKRMGDRLLGYEPGVVLHESDGRWVIDVSRRDTASSLSDLRYVTEFADRELSMKGPLVSWEFTVEGERYPAFFQGREFSRTQFDHAHPFPDIRDVAYTIERGVRDRFGVEPFVSVYQKECNRYDVHVSLERPDQHDALRGRLRSLRDFVYEQYPLLDIRLLVDREPLSPGRSLIEPRGAALDLGSLDFNPALRLR